MRTKSIIENLTKPTTLAESSLSRIWQHVAKPGAVFAVISSYLGELPRTENEQRFSELQQEIRGAGYGYIRFNSGYTYADGSGTAEEKSLLITGIALKDALDIAQKYGQESILYKDDSGFFLVGSRGEQIGQNLLRFQSDGKTLTFDPEATKIAFSKLARSKQASKFAFVPESFVVTELPELRGLSCYLLHKK